MESLPMFLWQVLSIGSVFAISILVGHLSLQRKVNLWLRTAIVVTWLMLLAIVGVGQVWVMNVSGLLILWAFEFILNRAVPIPLLVPPTDKSEDTKPEAETTPRIQHTVFSIIIGGCIGIGMVFLQNRSWTFGMRGYQWVTAVLIPLPAFYCMVLASTKFETGGKKTAGLLASFLMLALGVYIYYDLCHLFLFNSTWEVVVLCSLVAILCCAVLLLTLYAPIKNKLVAPTVAVILAMLGVTGWHSYHLLQIRMAVEQISSERPVSEDLNDGLQSPHHDDRFGAWELGTQMLLGSWANPDPKEDQAMVRRKIADVRKWDESCGDVDFVKAAFEHPFQNGFGWQHQAREQLQFNDIRDRKKLMFEISNGRFRTACRIESVRLAAKLAEYEHGKKVRSFAELNELTGFEIPDDPFGKGPLKELVQDGTWRVYSVGDDVLDSQGVQFQVSGNYEAGGYYIEKWIGDIGLTIE